MLAKFRNGILDLTLRNGQLTRVYFWPVKTWPRWLMDQYFTKLISSPIISYLKSDIKKNMSYRGKSSGFRSEVEQNTS